MYNAKGTAKGLYKYKAPFIVVTSAVFISSAVNSAVNMGSML